MRHPALVHVVVAVHESGLAAARLRGRRDRLIQFPFQGCSLVTPWHSTTRSFPVPSSGRSFLRTRNLKMARNAHAYVRGSTVKFYEWLEDGGRKLPPGPSVWICGDCHLGNLGPLA